MSELKPCPFCGSYPITRLYDRLIVIGCNKCGYERVFEGCISLCPSNCMMPSKSIRPEYFHANARERAFADWNTRAEVKP